MNARTETIDSVAELFPEERLAATTALSETHHAVADVISRRAVEPVGLDAGTAELLVRLSQSAACGIRGVHIGELCHMTATRVSRLVDRAAAAGLVERLPDPSDRRAQHVALTEKGREAAHAYAPRMQAVLDELVFASLSAPERATLIELLGRVNERARQMLAGT